MSRAPAAQLQVATEGIMTTGCGRAGAFAAFAAGIGLIWASPVAAQQGSAGTTEQRAQRGGDAGLGAACADVVRGERRADDQLRERCAELLVGRAEASDRRAPASVTPGERRGSDDVRSGDRVLAAFSDAGRELVRDPGRNRGMLRSGASLNSLTTNPIGMFTGQGFNLRYARALQERFSLVLGGRYSSTDALEGNVSAWGLNGGLDYFIVGRNNEGLYLGPRTELGYGSTDLRGGRPDDFFRFGLGGEVGYNFIATNGITGGLGFGANVRVTGETDETLDALGDPDAGLYLRAALGYSW